MASWRLPPLLGLLILLAGCSTSANRITLFPQGHNLLESTRDVRQQYTGAPLPLPRELSLQVQPLYTVEPGDVLLVQPVSLDSPVRLPGDQPILPDGTINLGRYGLINVASKTVPEIEALISSRIATQTKDAGAISVRIVTRASKVYYVLGEVNAPGAFPFQGNETVLKAILTAGGLTERASRKDIVLARPTPPGSCRIVLPICYREIVQLGDTTTNYQLAPGDRIFVASRAVGEDFWNCRHEASPCGCQTPTTCPLGAAPVANLNTDFANPPVSPPAMLFPPTASRPTLPVPMAPTPTLSPPTQNTGGPRTPLRDHTPAQEFP